MPDAPAWSADLLTDPHAIADKRRRVRDMFAAIAPSYDLNNRLHSFGRDQAWRRAAVKMAELKPSDLVVDVACGTGDLTLSFYEGLLWEKLRLRNGFDVPSVGQVIGIDYTFEMLVRAKPKAQTASFHGHVGGQSTFEKFSAMRASSVQFLNGDAQQLPLPDACCDVVSIAFGIRNVQNVDAALVEFCRVLRPGGRLIVLEFSEPTNPIIRSINRFYCGQVMPRTATWISHDRSGAYKYLPKSVATFMTREQMTQHLTAAGFDDLRQKPMTFGVCVCYRGTKA